MMSVRNLLTFIALVASASQGFGDLATFKVDQNLADVISKSNFYIQDNPQRSSQCFSIYMPKLNHLTNIYEAEHGKCLGTAQAEIDVLNSQLQSEVTEVSQLHENICSEYSKCQVADNSDAYTFFDCNNDAAGQSITTSYNIQKISKDRMEFISLRKQLIEYNKNTCADKCSQNYVEDTTQIHSELQDCLAGKIPVDTTTTTTRTTVTHEPTLYPTPPTIDD